MFKIFVKRSVYCSRVMGIIDLILTLLFWPSDYSNLAKTVEYSVVKPMVSWVIQ